MLVYCVNERCYNNKLLKCHTKDIAIYSLECTYILMLMFVINEQFRWELDDRWCEMSECFDSTLSEI